MSLEYYRRGTSKWLWSTSAPSAPPTAAQITAAVDISPQLNAIDGFTTETEFIDIENLSTRTTPKLAGPINVEGGTLTFNEQKAASGVTAYNHDTIRSGFAQDTTGYLIACPYGTATGNNVEVWGVTVGSNSRSWDMGATPAKYMVDFAATAVPVFTGNIAA